MFPQHISNVVIHTGNLINSKEFKRKATQSPSEEVFDSVCGTFHSWLKICQLDDFQNMSTVSCINKEQVIKVEKDDRVNLKISVKIFIESFQCEDLKESVAQAMSHLDISLIDSLILALPSLPSKEALTLDHIKPFWKEMENLVATGKVVTIGISDLDAPQLAELYNWTQVKPSVNQVNLDSCCVMPAELTAFAKENDIQLLTHNDPKVILPCEMMQKIMEPATLVPERWETRWIARYSVVVKCRGIIQNKGYILCSSLQHISS